MYALVDLQERSIWDVSTLLAHNAGELWEYQSLVPLATLAQVQTPQSEAEDEEPVVTPAGVDYSTGDVSTRRGRAGHRLVLRVGTTNSGAHLGDVLVPQVGDRPCVLIGKQHSGLSFVNFVALRPEQRITGLWLWAALSSTRGRTLRKVLAIDSAGRVPLAELVSASIPSPPPAWDPRYTQISTLHAHTAVTASSEGRSWWRSTALPADGQWQRYLVTPTPDIFDDGTPLGELATIAAGRNPAIVFEQPRPGARPVLNGSSIDGQHVYRWAEPDSGLAAETGDVAVVEVGVRGRAAIVMQPSIAGTGVLLLKPNRHVQGEALAAYLRSELAQTLRGTLISGVIPRLSRTALSQLPVPDKALSASASDFAQQVSSVPLDEQLEQLLWG